MPPRYAYWTIILEGMPTAFRAHTEDELLPTLRQLQSKHPDAVMKWFARGRLWHSPEEERLAAAMKRRPARERRPPAWRPGGEHRDPREKFKVPRDEKRRRFAAKPHREGGKPAEGFRTDRAGPGRDRRPNAGARGPARPFRPGAVRSGPHGRGPRRSGGRGGGGRGGGRRGGGGRGQ